MIMISTNKCEVLTDHIGGNHSEAAKLGVTYTAIHQCPSALNS